MKGRSDINFCAGRCLLLIVSFLALFVCSCSTAKKSGKVIYISERNIPKKIAVLSPVFFPDIEKKGGLKSGTQKGQEAEIQPEAVHKSQFSMQLDPKSEKGLFVARLFRGVLNNQLNGKGYSTQVLNKVDKNLGALKGKTWEDASPKELCKILDVDALIYSDIISVVMMKALAYDEYSIKARIRMVNDRGDTLGTWTESSSKRNISLPTSPIGAAAAVLGAVMDESERKHMRLVVYDLGWKITQSIPDSPYKGALPEVMSVDTNIDKGVFAAGQRIEVKINAEKDLTCSFDLGDFKKDIPVSSVEGGVYKGSYLVRKGDQASMVPIEIRMVKLNGVERIWTETGGTVTIDGIAPPPPENVRISSSREGVSVLWSLPQAMDLQEFIVERGDSPVGDFVILKKTKEQDVIDTEVTQGSTHYYRVRSVDKSGNRSLPTSAIKGTMPFFDAVKLPEIAKGSLVPGVYLVEMESLIPEGETLKIGSGSSLKFSPGTRLDVKGTLKIEGNREDLVFLKGKDWGGIYVDSGGRAEISYASMQDSSPCLEVEEGNLDLQSVTIKGAGGGDGIIIGQGSRFDLKDITVGSFDKGIVIKGGAGSIKDSTVTNNHVGFKFLNGTAELTNNNIYGNTELEVLSQGKLVLHDNYIGSATLKDAKLKGDILVKSLLDAPYPHGRKIVLVDDKDITPEAIIARFKKQKSKGIAAFQQRKFGDAYQFLSKAMALKEDKEVYLYTIYTQMNLGEDFQAEKTLKKGMKAFPYEVRFYQIYARYLASKGKNEEALSLLEKALRMNPDDNTLKMMKESLIKPVQPAASAEKVKAEINPLPQQQGIEPEKKGLDFQELKSKGLNAFNERKFKDADTFLNKALSVKDDREVYLYLAYTQMSLGMKTKLEKTIENGLKAFPDEIGLYRIYVKYLTAAGERKKALSLVEKGLKIAPDDRNLKFMKEYLSEK